MKSGTLLGIILGSIAIFGAFIWEGGSVNSLFMLPAMLIVFGGTIAAGIAGSSLQTVLKIPALIRIAFFPKKFNKKEIANQIVEFSAIARKDGFLVLENKIPGVKHPYLGKLMQVCIDGVDPETYQNIHNIELNTITERHNVNSNLFIKLGGYSPTMGIIGTVMGLIATLAAAGSDPNVLIHHIATAFIATMWGIFMANIVWLPLGDKLKSLNDEEIHLLQMMIDGVYSILIGESPHIVSTKIVSSFPLADQEEMMEQHRKFRQQFISIKYFQQPVQVTTPQFFSSFD